MSASTRGVRGRRRGPGRRRQRPESELQRGRSSRSGASRRARARSGWSARRSRSRAPGRPRHAGGQVGGRQGREEPDAGRGQRGVRGEDAVDVRAAGHHAGAGRPSVLDQLAADQGDLDAHRLEVVRDRAGSGSWSRARRRTSPTSARSSRSGTTSVADSPLGSTASGTSAAHESSATRAPVACSFWPSARRALSDRGDQVHDHHRADDGGDHHADHDLDQRDAGVGVARRELGVQRVAASACPHRVRVHRRADPRPADRDRDAALEVEHAGVADLALDRERRAVLDRGRGVRRRRVDWSTDGLGPSEIWAAARLAATTRLSVLSAYFVDVTSATVDDTATIVKRVRLISTSTRLKPSSSPGSAASSPDGLACWCGGALGRSTCGGAPPMRSEQERVG